MLYTRVTPQGKEPEMNEIKTARNIRKMTQEQLGEMVGMSKQQLSGIERGDRNPGPKVLPLLADALNVSPAYLRGEAEAIPVVDFADGSTEMCAVISCETIEGYGALYLVEHPVVGPLPVILADGVQFTPSDWQGELCASAEDAAGFAWVDARGNDAVMLDGLPRIMA